jgi:AcrR family transcriptional regulator
MAFRPARLLSLFPAFGTPPPRSTLISVDSPSVPNPSEPDGFGSAAVRGYAVRSERERLLAALVQVGSEKGYEGITVAEVAEVAGLTQGDFDRHFADKEACFLAAYEAMSDVLIAHATAAFEGAEGRPWADRVTLALRALVELLAAQADLARMPIIEVTAIAGDARVRYRQALDRFTPFLEKVRGVSERGADLPPDTARFAIGGASSLIFDEFRAGRGAELEAVLPDLVFAVTMPYLGVAAAEAEMRKVESPN